MPNKLIRGLTMHKVLNKTQQIGAELVVRTLEMQGVTHVFGIPGAKIDSVFNALVDSKIETVVCRHEQNAAFIAGGIGRMTGKAGVAIATSGPGVSNLTTGLATANSAPICCVLFEILCMFSLLVSLFGVGEFLSGVLAEIRPEEGF